MAHAHVFGSQIRCKVCGERFWHEMSLSSQYFYGPSTISHMTLDADVVAKGTKGNANLRDGKGDKGVTSPTADEATANDGRPVVLEDTQGKGAPAIDGVNGIPLFRYHLGPTRGKGNKGKGDEDTRGDFGPYSKGSSSTDKGSGKGFKGKGDKHSKGKRKGQKKGAEVRRHPPSAFVYTEESGGSDPDDDNTVPRQEDQTSFFDSVFDV